jgi:hypothetical protein
MKSTLVLVFSISVAVVGSAIVAAPQTPRPGEMTQARVWIENRASGESIPVAIDSMSLSASPLRVEVLGTTEVALVPTTVVQTRATRQTWEYRLVPVLNERDPQGALNSAGAEGWEAVGTVIVSTDVPSVLLKRPR